MPCGIEKGGVVVVVVVVLGREVYPLSSPLPRPPSHAMASPHGARKGKEEKKKTKKASRRPFVRLRVSSLPRATTVGRPLPVALRFPFWNSIASSSPHQKRKNTLTPTKRWEGGLSIVDGGMEKDKTNRVQQYE